ncbi:MAG: hypothetical protein ACI3XJ_12150 [Oscillospiraceae bacterium]
MAQVVTTDSTKIYQLQQWLGLNESPDGDTGLKLGEAAVMRNFRVTREGHLQIRPGYAPVCTVAEGSPVRGLWSGYVNGQPHLLCACGGHLWDIDRESGAAADRGEIDDGEAFFFGFARKVYLLTGQEYYRWDGAGDVEVVEGYVPIVTTATPPAGGGTLLERVNNLTGKRRAVYSPDGESAEFHLAETGIDEVLGVEGTDLSWTADPENGTVTFASAPPKGVNTITITWRKGDGFREKVTAMRWAEFYNGSTDARVFLYGDGTNETVYSDLDQNGQPSAEYFPDLNVMAVDSANTPITAMIRHYDRLLVFKTDGAWSAQYDALALETGTVTAAFYTVPLNREIGCAAPGQARLVQNNPRTLFGRAVYTWALASGAARDERNAKRISDRVENTLSGFDLAACTTFDDERRQEYYVVCGDRAVIHNYGNDTWYCYDHFPARRMVCADGELYFGTENGTLMHVSRQYRNDDLEPIDAWWESGSLDFERDWRRKYSTDIWVSIKPESQGRVTVTAQSNRRSEYVKKEVAAGLSTFTNADFAHWSFRTNRKPQVQRVRLKVRKFTFYKLILSSCSASATATVLAADIRVRYAGKVR